MKSAENFGSVTADTVAIPLTGARLATIDKHFNYILIISFRSDLQNLFTTLTYQESGADFRSNSKSSPWYHDFPTSVFSFAVFTM